MDADPSRSAGWLSFLQCLGPIDSSLPVETADTGPGAIAWWLNFHLASAGEPTWTPVCIPAAWCGCRSCT